MATEMTYLEHLSALYKNVQSDTIPAKEKKEILKLINDLVNKLLKYSA